MADVKYSGINRGEDTRYKVNNNILRMMNANPALGIGYLVGNAIGENYFGKKRANTKQGLKEAWDKRNGSIGADESGVYGTDSKKPDYYSTMNEAFKEYKQGNPAGVVVDTANGVYPKTPQQANKSTETPTVGKMWEGLKNGSGYNPGDTGLFTNGVRDIGNVIGADANGVYGVPNGRVIADPNGYYGVQAPAPKTPIQMSYTPEQLAQIQAYGKFTPEELQRMGAGQLAAPPVQAAPAQSGGLLTNVANNAAQAQSGPNYAGDFNDAMRGYAVPVNPLSEADDHELENLAVAALTQTPETKNAWWNTQIGLPHAVDSSQPWWNSEITLVKK